MRTESLAEAVRIDAKLRSLWARHPHFTLVPHNPSFFKKISFGLAVLESIVAQYGTGTPVRTRVAQAKPTGRKRR